MIKRKTKGFTLVELMTVLVILGILVGLGINKYADSVDKAKKQTFCSNVKEIINVIETSRTMNGVYPTFEEANNLIQSATFFSVAARNPYKQTKFQLSADDPAVEGDIQYVRQTPDYYILKTIPDCGIVNL